MSSDVLEDIRGYARAGRIRYTRHAHDRMYERGAKEADVESALRNARSCVRDEEDEDKWKVTGPDTDGDDLTVVVVVYDGDLVITLF